MISQIFILSARGDTIINRDFRSDLIKNTPELFFRNVKLYKGDAPPIFNLEGINFAYLKKSSLYVVATSRFNVSPSFILQLLNRIFVIIKDFLGVLNEQVIRKNFVLVYELLDQVIDFGSPQITSTEQIKPLIVNQLIHTKSHQSSMVGVSVFAPNTISSSASNIAVGKNKQNQIYVDIFQKINIIFNSSGYVINSAIDGCIQMKSYLHGNPSLKLMLNQDLSMSPTNKPSSVVLDDCNFHESVNYSQFQMNKTLRINPPEGQFIVMNYRVATDFNAPFRLSTFIQQSNPYKLELVLKLKATFPKQTSASFITAKFLVPKTATSVNTQIIKNPGNQKADYKQSNRTVEWVIKKMAGQTQYSLITKISLPQANILQGQKQIGPINLSFQIPMFNVSGLQIKNLKILKEGEAPNKWVRYLTKSSSYVCRI